MNRFKSRNFDDHHVNFAYRDISQSLRRDSVVSDSQYDRSRFITHAFIPTSDGVRCCGSVELAFSRSPEISSYVPADLRSKLQSSVVSPQSRSSRLSDDDLLKSVPSNFGLERNEIVDLSRMNSSFIPSEAASVETASVETASVETASVETASAE